MADDTFSGSDFESAASATASPDSAAVETAQSTGETTAQTAEPASLETAATGQAAAATTTVSELKGKQGPIPFDVHHTALENARTKAVEEYRQRVGWAEHVPREQFEQMASWYNRAASDPVAFALDVIDELAANEEHAPVLRSRAGRLLRAARQQQPTHDPDIPDVEILDGQGQSLGKLRDVVERLVAARVGPLEQDKQTREKREKEAAYERELDAYTTRESARIRSAVEKLPHAKDHWAAIVEKAKTYPDEIPVGEALRDAYHEVVMPQLSTLERKKVLADISQKPAASTVSPSSGTTAVSKPDAEKGWEELFEEKASQFLGKAS